MQYLVMLLFVLVLLVFWIIQFAQLMAMRDDEFPGRFDKILWFIAFLTLNVVAASIFLSWKQIAMASRTKLRTEALAKLRPEEPMQP
jgi:hypothetical protein